MEQNRRVCSVFLIPTVCYGEVVRLGRNLAFVVTKSPEKSWLTEYKDVNFNGIHKFVAIVY
jgi:hypothetical protein